MNVAKQFSDFLELVGEEPRLGPSHISLYLSIVMICYEQNKKMTGTVKRNRLMKQAKIFSSSTYHKCMKELCDLGYVFYEPCFDSRSGSVVRLRRITA
jgi:hypothetical protein